MHMCYSKSALNTYLACRKKVNWELGTMKLGERFSDEWITCYANDCEWNRGNIKSEYFCFERRTLPQLIATVTHKKNMWEAVRMSYTTKHCSQESYKHCQWMEEIEFKVKTDM